MFEKTKEKARKVKNWCVEHPTFTKVCAGSLVLTVAGIVGIQSSKKLNAAIVEMGQKNTKPLTYLGKYISEVYTDTTTAGCVSSNWETVPVKALGEFGEDLLGFSKDMGVPLNPDYEVWVMCEWSKR